MKFYCDNCQTKYSIAEEKVRGKVLKVRCKKCSHIITVREPKAPVRATASPATEMARGGGHSPSPGPPPQKQWHYSVNGQSYGPFEKSVLDEKFASRELGDAAYVWNESFTDWKRVTEVPAFAKALEKANSVRPSPKTFGVSSALKAIDTDSYDKGHDQDSEPSTSQAQESAPLDQEVAPEAAEPSEPGLSDSVDREPKKAGEPQNETDQESASIDAKLPESIRTMRRNNRSPDKTDSAEGDSAQGRKDRLEELRQRLRLGPEADSREVDEKPGDDQETPSLSEESDAQVLDEPVVEPDQDAGAIDEEQLTPAEAREQDEDIGDISLESEADTEEELTVPSALEAEEESEAKVQAQKSSKDKKESSGLLGSLFGGSKSEKPETEKPPLEDRASVDELDVDVAHADTLSPEELAEESGASEDSGISPPPAAAQKSEHDGLFSVHDGEAPSVEPAPTPEAVEPSGDEEQAEDAVPFFPSAPTLEKEEDNETSTSISRADEVTDSLLIQLDELKNDGRKQAIVGGIGALVALVTVGVVGYFGFVAASSTDSEEGGNDEPRIIEDGFGAAPDFSSYDSEQLAAISEEHVLEEQELGEMEVEDEEAQPDETTPEDAAASAQQEVAEPSEEESDSSFPSVDTGDIDVDTSDEAFEGARAGRDDGAGVGGSALGREEGAAEGGGAGLDSLGDEGFGAGLDLDDGGELEVHEIDEDLGIGQQEIQQGLSAQDRFSAQQQITGRVVHCRQRHYNRGEGDLPSDSVEVQFYVLPDGEIVEFEITPASMADTLFAECLERDTRHWNYFPRFEGNPERIVLPMSLE